MMSNNLNTILKCICIAVLSVVVVNLISFLLEIATNGLGDNWFYKWKHGMFYVDDKPVGFMWGETKTNVFMVVMFIISMIKNWKKGGFA